MIRTNVELLEYVNRNIKNTKTHFIEEKIARNTILVEQNQNIIFIYVIKTGIAKCYLTEDTGNDFIQEFFGEGELFGEIETMNESLSFCAIESISDVVVYKISKIHFSELLENDKKFNRLVIKTMANKIKNKAIRHSHNQPHSIKIKFIEIRKIVF